MPWPRLWLAVLLLVALGALSLTGFGLWRLRAEALDRQLESAALHANAFEDHLTQSLNVIELTLTNASEMAQAGFVLQAALRNAPYLRSISLVDAGGRISTSSDSRNVGVQLSPQVFLPASGQPLALLRIGPLWDGRDFHNARPTQAGQVAPNQAFIPVWRDVALASGRWVSLVAAVNADYFLNYYGRNLEPELGQVDVLRSDGTLLLSTALNFRPGSQYPGTVSERLLRTDAGSFQQAGADGQALSSAYRASRSHPITLVLHLQQQAVLQRWQHEATLTLAAVLGVLLAGLALTLGLQRRAQRLLQQNVRAQEDAWLASRVFDAANDAMLITDPQGSIERVNAAFTRLTGYNADEAIGQNPRLLQSGRHDSAFFAALWQAIQGPEGHWQGEIWNRRKDGQIYPEWLNITAVPDQRGVITHFVAAFFDITERKAAEEEIRQLAYYDPLTGLPNRRLLLDRLQQAQANARRNHWQGALLFIDLDYFKSLNDSFGHDYGDLLLQQVAERLGSFLRQGDTAARLGGDEFVVMLTNLSAKADEAAVQARVVGEKLLMILNQIYDLKGHLHQCGASIGVSLFSDELGLANVDDVLRRADLALYQAKEAGRGTLRFFDARMQADISARAALEVALRVALQEGQLRLYYQPQVDGRRRMIAVEALVRWQHPEQGLLLPAAFMGLAEDTRLIQPLGYWVLQSACRQLAQWAMQPQMEQLDLAVNIGVRQIRHENFVSDVMTLLHSSAARPQRLVLEISEALLDHDVDDIARKMQVLKQHGVRFALDGFGTGSSNLGQLRRLPLDQLKIDLSFVRGALLNRSDDAIIQALLALGRSLGLRVVALGVESASQQTLLAHYGCQAYQGYLFGHPMTVQELEQRAQPSQLAEAARPETDG